MNTDEQLVVMWLGFVTRLSRELTHHIMSDPYHPCKIHTSLSERPNAHRYTLCLLSASIFLPLGDAMNLSVAVLLHLNHETDSEALPYEEMVR